MRKNFYLLAIVCAVLVTYAPALRNGFVWDDTALVLRDPLIRSWRLIPEGFNHFLFTDATASDFYRPLQRLTYTIDYAAYPLQTWGYHLTSILWHAAAAIALFLCADELLFVCGIEERRRRFIAFCATLLWAIHPAHSAAVAYIAGRADPLAACFGFFGLWAGLRGLRAEGTRGLLVNMVAAALLLCSALSKESGFVFLLAWFAVLIAQKQWKALVPASAVAVGVLLVYLSLRLPAENVPPPTLHRPAPLLVRPIVVARAAAEYAGLFVLPLSLHMERDVETHPTGLNDASLTAAAWRELQTLAGLLLIALLIVWLVRSRKTKPAIFVCLLLTIITYLPVSGIFPLNATAAEHWIYIPAAFLLLAGASAVTDWLPRRSFGLRAAAAGVLAIWAVFLAGRTFVRTFDWKDQRTFLERTIAAGGNSARMLINLGGLELSEGRLDEAKRHLEEALKKEPDQPFAIINLATVAVKQNDYSAARALLKHATDLPLVDAQAHELLAVVENNEHGRTDLLRLRLASRTGPPNWAIEKRYVAVLAETGNVAKAIEELRGCLQTQWYRAETWLMLSQLLDRIGAKPQAQHAREIAHAYDVHLDARPLPL
jgi:tetratricopeptide (TPR) repeat protein